MLLLGRIVADSGLAVKGRIAVHFSLIGVPNSLNPWPEVQEKWEVYRRLLLRTKEVMGKKMEMILVDIPDPNIYTTDIYLGHFAER
jgi:hypothetical protein